MFLDQLSSSPQHRLTQILHTLKHVHGYELPVQDAVKLQECAAKAYMACVQIKGSSAFNTYMQEPEYVKANLILEAINMLTEVSPKRRKTMEENKESAMPVFSEAKSKSKPDFLDMDKDGDRKEPMKQAIKQAASKSLEEKKGAKPDFLDMDKDGDRKEPMKQAIQQAKHRKVNEHETLRELSPATVQSYANQAKREYNQMNVWASDEGMGPYRTRSKTHPRHWSTKIQTKRVKGLDMAKKRGIVPTKPGAGKYVSVDAQLRSDSRGSMGSRHMDESQTQQYEITFVFTDDKDDTPQTVVVKAPDPRKAQILFKADYPDAYIEKIVPVLKEKPFLENKHKSSKHGPKIPGEHMKVKQKVLSEDQNLDKAQTLLAAKDLCDRLQKMAEDAAKMAVDDLMPLVDTMKDQFGLEAAGAFNNVVKANLQTVLDSIIAAKDQTDNAINTMETGDMPTAPTNIAQPLPPMSGQQADAEPEAETGAPAADAADADAAPTGDDIDFEKEFDATPATSGPEEEPLGRSKKEVSETTLTPAQQKAQQELARHAAEQMVKTRKKPDGKMATSQELADAKKLISEKLTKSMSAGEVISDFVHSDDPKFKGKSKAQRTKMALGAYYGMHPEKKRKQEKLSEIRNTVRDLKEQFDLVQKNYKSHCQTLGESWINKLGDLQSAVYENQMQEIRNQIGDLVSEYKQIQQELTQINEFEISTKNKIAALEQQVSKTPYGVLGESVSGTKFRKFFETQELRHTWLSYHSDRIKTHEFIEPEHVKQVTNRLGRLI